MNIAILIGISEYKNNIQNLPGSKNDVVQFDNLIRSIKKFDDVLTISKDTDSVKLKEKLTEFINSKKDKTIDEVLFYFSGHGDYANDEFYYILSDFSFDKRTQTSLQNSELDNLIKSLKPKLVSKIVDACHSGVNYIKDLEAIDTYIKSTSNQFNKCYFLYSSLNSQSSFQNDQYSFFTLSFFNAIKKFQEKSIRYKDIIDYISDEFSSFPEQTPFFVTQADFTEFFCTKNANLQSFLETVPDTFPTESSNNEEPKKFSSLAEIIKQDAQNHLSFDEVIKILEEIKNRVDNFKLSEEIETLYQFKTEFSKHIMTHANYGQIGQFVAKNQSEYFARPTYKTETYEDLEKPSRWDRMTGSITEPYTITRKRDVVEGYTLNVSYPYSQIIIQVNSLFPNIDSYNCTIAFICSDRKIKLYYFITNYKRENWKDKRLNMRYEWNASELQLIEKDKIFDFVKSINDKINSRITTDLKRQFESEKE